MNGLLKDAVRSRQPAAHSHNGSQSLAPMHEDDGDTSSSSASSTSSISSTGTLIPTSASHTSGAAPTMWDEYFQRELFLEHPDITYHVYISPPKDIEKDPLFVCHHGAGSSGLSFALFSESLKLRLPNAGLLSVDCRAHGSVAAPPNQTNLSLDILEQDLVNMINSTKEKLAWPELPNMIFVGHSLGGSVVTRVAKSGTFGAKLTGFAVIDVVEGSAMDALKSMQSLLAGRPKSFGSIDEAIEWEIRSRTIRNPESVKVSMPPLLLNTDAGEWVWKTDLYATRDYWEDWFKGMSQNFLAGKAAKLLILAGTDRLDKDLMIGQMQGKFQLSVFPDAGHFVQEDQPEKTADKVVEFYHRNDRSNLVLPPKVSDLLAQGKKV